MARDLSLENFLRELGTRLGAAAVVVAIFVGLGYLGRMDGLSGLLDSQLGFFVTAFALVGVTSVVWVVVQRHRSDQ